MQAARRISRVTASREVFHLSLALMACAAFGVVLFATRWGAALSDDSYFYVKPARDLLAGRTPFFSPHYPPLLPLVVTLIGLFRIEPLLGIRLLNAACFGLNVFLAGLLIFRLSTSRGAALAGALLMLTAQVMVEVHSWAMSEALFITFSLATVLAFERYFHSRKIAWLVGCAFLAGCAALTRYAGIGLIGSGALVLLVLPGESWPRRLRGALLFALLSGVIFAFYTLVYASAMHELDRFGGIRFVLLDGPEIREALYTMLLWLVPGRLVRGREVQAMAALLVLGIGMLAVYARMRRPALLKVWGVVRGQPEFLLLVLFLAANVFMLYQAHISPTYRSPFDARLLSPTFAVLLVLIAGLAGLFWKVSGWMTHAGILLLLGWLIFLYLPRSADFVASMRDRGAGFAAPYWHNLDAGPFILSHRQEELVTTAPMGVYFALGVETKGVSMNPQELRSHLYQTGGYLIVFDSMPLEMYGYPAQEFLKDMVPVAQFDGCVVYQPAR